MNDELILTLADMTDISPKNVRLIINAYEKAKTGYKPAPEGYTSFEYKGKRYAYKSLGDGLWTPECTSLELMKVLRNYFISSGKMEECDCWPGSSYCWAWTSDVYSSGRHVVLDSCGSTYHHGGGGFARFTVIPQLTERKKF